MTNDLSTEVKHKKKRGRRDWVKNAIIVFLSVLLVLTFFSNTIMNYSLPEVAAQYPQSTTITTKIRGTGTVESAQSYNVTVQENRTIAAVNVKKGDTIKAGQTLLTLDATESQDLQDARTNLSALKLEYDKMQLPKSEEGAAAQAASLSQAQSAVSKAETALSTARKNASDLKWYQDQVTSAKNSASSASAAKNSADSALEALKAQLDTVESGNSEYLSAQQDLASKKDIYTAMKASSSASPDVPADSSMEGSAYPESTADENDANDAAVAQALADYQAASAEVQRIYDEQIAPQKAYLSQQIDAAQQAAAEAATAEANANVAVESAQNALDAFQSSITGASDVASAESALQSAKDALATAQAAATDAANTTTYNNSVSKLELDAKAQEVKAAEEKVKSLEEKTSAANIVSRYAGVVTEVNVAAGDTTTPDTPLMVVELTEKGYTLKATVKKEQARLLKEGLQAEITNLWDSGINMTLTSITSDKSDPAGSRVLTFSVTSDDVSVGQSLSFSVGDKNASYDLVIPSAAIHTDSNGSFVYTVQVKSSPLGNRYTVKKKTVSIVASDETNSAVSGDLTAADFVITTSTVPLDVGSQVRIAE